MNISVHNFGDVKVMIDSDSSRYVTIGGVTKRFGLYAMAEVDAEYNTHYDAAKAYKTVFEKLGVKE